MNYLGLILALGLTAIGVELAFSFSDWNRLQACVTSGSRVCGDQTPPIQWSPRIWALAPRHL